MLKKEDCLVYRDAEGKHWGEVRFWMMGCCWDREGFGKMKLVLGGDEMVDGCGCLVSVRGVGVDPKMGVLCEVDNEEVGRVYRSVEDGQGTLTFPVGQNFGQKEVVVQNLMEAGTPLLIQVKLSDNSQGSFSLSQLKSESQMEEVETGWNDVDTSENRTRYAVIEEGHDAVFIIGFELQNDSSKSNYHYGHLEVKLVQTTDTRVLETSILKPTHFMISLEAVSGPEASQQVWNTYFADKTFTSSNAQNIISGGGEVEKIKSTKDDGDSKENGKLFWENKKQDKNGDVKGADSKKAPVKQAPKRLRRVSQDRMAYEERDELSEINNQNVDEASSIPHSGSNAAEEPKEEEKPGNDTLTGVKDEKMHQQNDLVPPKLHLPRWLRRSQVITLPSDDKPLRIRLRNASQSTIYLQAKCARHAPEEDQNALFYQESERCHDVSCMPASGDVAPGHLFQLTLQRRQGFEEQCMLLVECVSDGGRKLYGFPVKCADEDDMTLLYDQ